MVVMLDELTIEANEESFVIVLQHGGNDVTWKLSIDHSSVILFVYFTVYGIVFYLPGHVSPQ